MYRLATAVALVAACSSPGTAELADASDPPADAPEPIVIETLQLEVLAQVPHDPQAFTQGLELRDGVLYESTGLYGESTVRRIDPATGQVLAQVELPPEMFGEGLTIVGDRLWQLTWQDGVAFHRDRATLAVVGQAAYTGEGWGLCHDGARLIMSDGSSRLTFRDPATFAELGAVEITRDGVPIDEINELECVAGAVWANIWYSDEILRIDPDRGAVTGVVDASGLLAPDEARAADVLNGIAATATPGEFLLTGKLWPHVFRVRLTGR